MSISLYFTLFLILVALFGALRGRRRRFGRSMLHLARVCGAAAIAFFATRRLLFEAGTGENLDKAADALSGVSADLAAKLIDLTETLPDLAPIIVGLPLSFAGPIFFLVVYFVAKLVLWFPYIILAMALFPRKEKPARTDKDAEQGPVKSGRSSRLVGALINAVACLIATSVWLLPLMGYAHVTQTALDALAAPLADNEDFAKLREDFSETVDPLLDHPYSKLLYESVGEILFTELSTLRVVYRSEEYRLSVPAELDQYVLLYADLEPLLGKKIDSFEAEQADALRALAEDIEGSELVTILLAEIVSGACDAWSRGESFMDKAAPSADSEQGQQLLDAVIETFKDTTPSTLCEDLQAIADAIGVLAEYDVLGSLDDEEALLELLTHPEMIEDLMEALNGSESLKAVVKETTKVAVRAACSTLVADSDYDDATDELALSAANMLNTLSAVGTGLPADQQLQARVDALTAEMETTLEAYGVSEAPAILPYVSELLLEEFNEEMINGTVEAADVLTLLGFVTEE